MFLTVTTDRSKRIEIISALLLMIFKLLYFEASLYYKEKFGRFLKKNIKEQEPDKDIEISKETEKQRMT